MSSPVGLLTTVTGVSGSGKSSLVSHALTQLLGAVVGREAVVAELFDALMEASFTVVHGAVEFEQAHRRTLFIQRGEGSERTVQYEDAGGSPAGHEYRRSLADDG